MFSRSSRSALALGRLNRISATVPWHPAVRNQAMSSSAPNYGLVTSIQTNEAYARKCSLQIKLSHIILNNPTSICPLCMSDWSKHTCYMYLTNNQVTSDQSRRASMAVRPDSGGCSRQFDQRFNDRTNPSDNQEYRSNSQSLGYRTR